MSAPADPVIAATGLGRTFEGRTALEGVDLQVAPGEIVGVLGPDGAGKTTLMQLLAAILDPSAGSCRVLGFDTVRQADAVNRHIGYMPQGFSLYDRLTVDENLRFAARIRRLPPQTWRESAAPLLRMAGLEPFRERLAGHLSGGMQKKLALCTNLIHRPPLLLLDEPSMGVDPLSRRDLWQLLNRRRDEGATAVLTTSYLDEAEGCDRLALLHGGRVLAGGTPAELRGRLHGRVYQTASADPDLLEALANHSEVAGLQRLPGRVRFQVTGPDSMARLRAGLGPAAEAIQEDSPTLEDVYLARAGEAAPPPRRSPSLAPLAPRPPGPRGEGTIRMDEAAVRFGDFTAVDRVSALIGAGRISGWLGPNGAGKTTLIRALLGLVPLSGGTVAVAGLDPVRDSRVLRQRVGYMSQRFSLYPDLTPTENLLFFAGIYGLAGARRRRAMDWARQATGLGEPGPMRTGHLSGALRQRLALACALMHQPAVLFLDEPTSGVDPAARRQFWALIQGLAAGGMTVLVTTHYMEEAHYCHHLGLMDRGRLVASGALERLRDQAGLPPDASAERLFLALMDRSRSAPEREERA